MQAQTNTSPRLHIAPDLYLPVDTITSRNAFFGISGSGKTYTSLVLAEEMQKIAAQFVIVDPLGVAWGLRVPVVTKAASRQTEIRNEVYIFGGEHQDLPLDPGSGAAVADLVVTRNISVILDLSLFEDDEARARFVADFARQLLHINRSAIHVFVDEADLFAPQQPDTKAEYACRKAMDNLVRRGRVKGIGVSLISQRPAVVAKNLLTQITLLIVHQLTGRSDLDAVKGWVRDHGTDEQLKTVLESLPKLRAGQAVVWKPGGDAPIFEQTQIRRRRTFDSSATPEFGVAPIAPARLEPLDLEELRQELGRAIEMAEETDPEALRRLNADLKRQLAERPKAEPTIEIRERIVEKRVPVLEGDALLKVEALREFAAGWNKELPSFMGLLSALVRDYAEPVADQTAPTVQIVQTVQETIQETIQESAPKKKPQPSETTPVPVPEPPRPTAPTLVPTINLPDGARRILVSLSKHRKQRLSKAQIGAKAGLKWKTSGTFETYMRDHLKAGRIEQDGDLYRITDDGMRAIGLSPDAEQEPETTVEILAGWRDAMGNREFEALEMLVAAAPEGLSQEELRKRMGLAAGSGTFGGYIRTLRQYGLIEGDHQRWTAASVLFP